MVELLAAMDTEGVTFELTFIVIELEVAVGELTQVAPLVNTQLTTSPFEREDSVNVLPELLLIPFTFHSYDGVVPPFVGVGVKVTLEPEQIVVLLATIDNEGVTFVVTLIVTVFEVAVVVLTHDALLVNIQDTLSLFVNDELVYVLPVEVFTPFNFH